MPGAVTVEVPGAGAFIIEEGGGDPAGGISIRWVIGGSPGPGRSAGELAGMELGADDKGAPTEISHR